MKKMTIAMIAPVLALKPKAAKAAKSGKTSRPAKAAAAKAAKPVTPVKAATAKAKGEPNTDALDAPHAVKGKPHHYQYK